MMRSVFVAVALFAAAPFSAISGVPEELLRVQKEYQKSTGISAQFEQNTEVKSTRSTKKSQGRIWIKRPDKLRWETLTPDPNILVSDGKTFWFYTPPFEKGDRGQVMIKKTAQVQTRFLNALLSGVFDFNSTQSQIETVSKGEYILKPLKGTAGDVLTARVKLNLASHKIEEVTIDHTSGNRTHIQLKQIQLVSDLKDALFHFVPDRNTDRLIE